MVASARLGKGIYAPVSQVAAQTRQTPDIGSTTRKGPREGETPMSNATLKNPIGGMSVWTAIIVCSMLLIRGARRRLCPGRELKLGLALQ